MQDMMIQVQFYDWKSDDDPATYLRTGELVNPFTIDECGVNVEPIGGNADAIDVLCHRSNGEDHIFRINHARVDMMLPVIRRNGQWVVA